MPSSIERSAPADKASLPEVMTTPFTPASAEVCLTISSSSLIEVSSSTFIERPGMSQVTSTMPSASVSTLKFLKAMCCSLEASYLAGWANRSPPDCDRKKIGGHGASAPLPTGSDPFDDRRRSHAAADAERYQRSRLVGALELVEHGPQNHRSRRAQRMAQRDRAAVDVDLGIVDVEGLDVAKHHRGKSLVQLEQIDVRLLHAGTLEQLFGDVDGSGQHHRRLRADIGEGADFGARLQSVFRGGILAAEQHGARAVDDARRVAGVMHIVDALDFRMRLDRYGVEPAHLRDLHEGRL